VHALLAIPDKEGLLVHPVVRHSWEGFVVENLLNCAPEGVHGQFYRSSSWAEIDLLLEWPGGDLWAIEIKRSLSPKLERGFHSACADLKPVRKLLIYPSQETYRVAEDIEAMSPLTAAAKLAGSL
jgi:uncharacterized protein